MHNTPCFTAQPFANLTHIRRTHQYRSLTKGQENIAFTGSSDDMQEQRRRSKPHPLSALAQWRCLVVVTPRSAGLCRLIVDAQLDRGTWG